MWRWSSRIGAFTVGFVISLLAVFVYSLLTGLFTFTPQRTTRTPVSARCMAENYFASPETILGALKSEDVGVRRETWRRLYLRPGVAHVYYDYERDREYPERAAAAQVRYADLDGDGQLEALLTFVRFEQPAALVLQRDECGWQLRAALSAWLRSEDYPYRDWLEVVELCKPGTHELVLHESTGDAITYVRKARVLKLIDGTLAQVAEFTEEEIKPVAGYRGADWNAVKERTTTRYRAMPATTGRAPLLQLETVDEVIKYEGVAPLYTYWLETDGAWHALAAHWRTRPAERVKLLAMRTEYLSWDGAQQRFSVDER